MSLTALNCSSPIRPCFPLSRNSQTASMSLPFYEIRLRKSLQKPAAAVHLHNCATGYRLPGRVCKYCNPTSLRPDVKVVLAASASACNLRASPAYRPLEAPSLFCLQLQVLLRPSTVTHVYPFVDTSPAPLRRCCELQPADPLQI